MIRCSRCFKVYQYSDNECGLFKHSSEKKILVHLICNDCGSHYETMKIITETGVVDVLKLRDINNHYNNIIEGSDWHFIDNSKLPLSTYSSSNSIPVPSTITVKRPRSLCYFNSTGPENTHELTLNHNLTTGFKKHCPVTSNKTEIPQFWDPVSKQYVDDTPF